MFSHCRYDAVGADIIGVNIFKSPFFFQIDRNWIHNAKLNAEKMNTKMNFQYKGGELAPFMEISKGYVKLSVRLPRMPSLNNVGTQA